MIGFDGGEFATDVDLPVTALVDPARVLTLPESLLSSVQRDFRLEVRDVISPARAVSADPGTAVRMKRCYALWSRRWQES